MATFLAHYLKDQGAPPASEALTFRTGANEWMQHDAWPPVKGVTPRRLYFQEDGKLAFTQPPATKDAFDSYLSDPHSPVPYRPRPITLGRGWSTWLVEDQRFVHGRPDVRTYVTDPLTEPVVVAGQVAAHLFAATSGTDSDWIVKLIDVYPEKFQDETMRGFQLMIAGDVIRGRYHKSIERPTALVPNVPVEYVIPFPANDHAFGAGHRIMVQVQSTWFPVIDRNPQKFVSNIFLAQPADFIPATQRIFRSGAQASHILLPVAAAAPR
jgi:putative CocE/NonD family hydrolase